MVVETLLDHDFLAINNIKALGWSSYAVTLHVNTAGGFRLIRFSGLRFAHFTLACCAGALRSWCGVRSFFSRVCFVIFAALVANCSGSRFTPMRTGVCAHDITAIKAAIIIRVNFFINNLFWDKK